MSMPNIGTPTYTDTLPLSDKTIKYRPFLVAEEKIMMMALESKNPKEILDAIYQIIENCTFNMVKRDDDDIPAVDLTWLFIQLRKRAKGEIADTAMRCVAEVDGKPCNTVNKVSIDLNNIELVNGDVKEKIIPINEQYKLVIRPPSIKKMDVLRIIAEMGDSNSYDDILYSMALMIDSLIDNETVYDFSEYTKEELLEFMQQLPADILRKIKEAFDDMPKWVYRTTFKCRKCGHTEDLVLEDLTHFFM